MITEYKGRQFTTAPGLRIVRERLGISQRELEKLSGLHRNQIMRIESGKNTTLKSLDKLADALGVDREMLLSEDLTEHTDSRFEDGAEGAGQDELTYVERFAMGGEVHDPIYEHALAEDYLRIFKLEGSTDEVFKLAVIRALRLGKERGKRLA